MALRPISEQQFRTRRKDRRMVWVDAIAVLVGLLMLVATVGGVVFVEPEPEPITWNFSFFEGSTKQKHCAGLTGVREGCTQVVQPRIAPEGETIKTAFDPVTAANVTSVTFTLTWVDEVPVTDGNDCGSECGKTYPYTNESTDILELTVIPPVGEPQTMRAANDMNTLLGKFSLKWDFVPMPGANQTDAFSKDEVRAQVEQEFTRPEHDALGEWQAEVTVIRAGDQNGTAPADACALAPGPVSGPLSDAGGEECDLDDDQGTVERSGVSDPTGTYESTYRDEGNSWIVEMAVRMYDTQISVA